MESLFIQLLKLCINLNFENITLIAGFMVQGHIYVIHIYNIPHSKKLKQ